MIAADEVLTLSCRRIDAHAAVLVKARTLAANACLERETHSCHLAGVHGVYVPENRTIVQNALIQTLGSLPRNFTADAEVVKKGEISGEAGIYASTERLRSIVDIGDIKIRSRL